MRFRFESNKETRAREDSDWRIDYELYILGMIGSNPLQTRDAIVNRLDELLEKLEREGGIDSPEYDEMLTCAIDANGITLTDLGDRVNLMAKILQNVYNSQVKLIDHVYRLRWYHKTGNWIRDQYRIWFVVEKDTKQILAESFKETVEEVNNEQSNQSNQGTVKRIIPPSTDSGDSAQEA